MRLRKASYEILTEINGLDILKRIEAAGRTCYKSGDKISDDSCMKFCRKIIKRGHLSVIEHESVSVRLITDRGVLQELARHRLWSLSVESTRYCTYSEEVEFIIPPWVDIPEGVYNFDKDQDYLQDSRLGRHLPTIRWANFLAEIERTYKCLLDEGWAAQQARSVLPNALKTEIVCTANLREWGHIFELRTSPAAHPQMREIMIPLLHEFYQKIPVLFDDLAKMQTT